MGVTRQQAAQQAASFYQELLLKGIAALAGLPAWQCPQGVVWEGDVPYPAPGPRSGSAPSSEVDEPSGDEEEEGEGPERREGAT